MIKKNWPYFISAIVFVLLLMLIIVGVIKNKTKEYQVTFNTNGGKEVSSLISTTIDESPYTFKKFHDFLGWYEDESFSGEALSFPYKIKHETVLYAKWQRLSDEIIIERAIERYYDYFEILEERLVDFTGFNQIEFVEGSENLALPDELNDEVKGVICFDDSPGVIVFKSNEAAEELNDYLVEFVEEADTLSKYVFSVYIRKFDNFYVIHEQIATTVLLYDDTVTENDMLMCDGVLLLYLGGDEHVTIPDTIEVISDFAFLGCQNLKKVTMGNYVKTIASDAFKDCVKLEEVTLSNQLKVVYDGAFQGCLKLKSIGLPSVLEFIGRFTFSGCANLEQIDLPSSLVYIGGDAFTTNSKLTNILIPISVVYIGERAFYESGITQIHCEGSTTMPKWQSGWNLIAEGVFATVIFDSKTSS